MRYTIILVGLIFIQGCATRYQETTEWDFKGGYFEKQLGEGLYRVTGRTDAKSFVNSSEAENFFHRRSTELCSKEGYVVIDQRETLLRDEPYGDTATPAGGTYIPIGIPGMAVALVEGEILCKNSSLTIEEVKLLIEKDV